MFQGRLWRKQLRLDGGWWSLPNLRYYIGYIVVAVSRTECEKAQHWNGSILNVK